MNRDLTESSIDRQNILNNSFALKKAEAVYNLQGVPFNGKVYYLNAQVADFFEVDTRTIERVLEENREELLSNDYKVIKGKDLADFKAIIKNNELTDISVGQTTRNLGISSFRTVLNFAMLINNSDKAKEIRSRILDIVIDVMAERTGGHAKYINQRDPEYLNKAFIEDSERKQFTNALNLYVDMNNYKYAYFTDYIYTAVFNENTREYKNILDLQKKDKARETMYSEILLLISSFEAGIAYEIEKEFKSKGEKLTKSDVESIIDEFKSHPAQRPLLNDARTKMVSRDLGLRDALHYKLEEYITPVTEKEFERFLGEQSKSLEQQIEEHKDVFLRLKDK